MEVQCGPGGGWQDIRSAGGAGALGACAHVPHTTPPSQPKTEKVATVNVGGGERGCRGPEGRGGGSGGGFSRDRGERVNGWVYNDHTWKTFICPRDVFSKSSDRRPDSMALTLRRFTSLTHLIAFICRVAHRFPDALSVDRRVCVLCIVYVQYMYAKPSASAHIRAYNI